MIFLIHFYFAQFHHFDEMDKNGIEYMCSVVESKEKLDKSLDDNLKTTRKQRI